MYGFSTADGFVEITESVAEMITYITSDPSVGLLYVQKHTHDAVPNIINLSDRVAEKSRESSWHAEDLEDSITVVSWMKECGFPIVDEMIKDIMKSLRLVSAKQRLKRGSFDSLDLGITMRKTRSWGSLSWAYGSEDVQQDRSNYFSTILKSARERASNLKWFQLEVESKEQTETEPQKAVQCPAPPVPLVSGSIPNNVNRENVSIFEWPELESKETIETEPQKLVRCQPADNLHEEVTVATEDNTKLHEEVTAATKDNTKLHDEVTVATEDNTKLSGDSLLFDQFKADKEPKLEQWLEGSEGKLDKSKGESDTSGV